MPELETALRQLGRDVEFPPCRISPSAIRGRLQRPRPWRRAVLIAVTLLVIAIGAALLVPPARTAILDWLGLRNVTASSRSTSFRQHVSRSVDLGREVSLSEAKRQAPWLRVPDESRTMSISATRCRAGGTLLWGTPARVRLLLTETTGRAVHQKVVQGDARVEAADIGEGGAWFQGQHVLMFRIATRAFHEGRARGSPRAPSPGS